MRVPCSHDDDEHDHVNLNVFSCRDGFVLSADCMLAPREAEMDCGPISALLGVIDCTELPEPVCAEINAQVDARQYAFVPMMVAMASNLRALIRDTARTA